MVLNKIALFRGLPKEILTDNGPEFTSKLLNAWAYDHTVEHVFTDPGKPMQNGYIESFNGKLRAECLNQHWFKSISEAKDIIEHWRLEYNQVRPHSSLDNLTPTCPAFKQFLTFLVCENWGQVKTYMNNPVQVTVGVLAALMWIAGVLGVIGVIVVIVRRITKRTKHTWLFVGAFSVFFLAAIILFQSKMYIERQILIDNAFFDGQGTPIDEIAERFQGFIYDITGLD